MTNGMTNQSSACYGCLTANRTPVVCDGPPLIPLVETTLCPTRPTTKEEPELICRVFSPSTSCGECEIHVSSIPRLLLGCSRSVLKVSRTPHVALRCFAVCCHRRHALALAVVRRKSPPSRRLVLVQSSPRCPVLTTSVVWAMYVILAHLFLQWAFLLYYLACV